MDVYQRYYVSYSLREVAIHSGNSMMDVGYFLRNKVNISIDTLYIMITGKAYSERSHISHSAITQKILENGGRSVGKIE